jgi:sterol desaturase/sphingolipid hydroxylase (fatty acid hydroxylase superfamily)
MRRPPPAPDASERDEDYPIRGYDRGMSLTQPGLYAFPAFVLLIALEAWLLSRRGQAYPWRESGVSLVAAVGYRLMQVVTALTLVGLYGTVWDQRLFTVQMDEWWSWPLLFLLVEFVYYWFHRASHEVRWLWTTHSVHHTPETLNFAAAYRLGWTGLFAGNWLFWLPLIWLGFPAEAVFWTLGLNLVYQFWLHTELIPRLGPLEWVFNTPSHHRVHHASNPDYLDRNYGGVLIVFDRLFGTFAGERADEPCRYGLVKAPRRRDVFSLQINEWRGILRDLRQARGWREWLGYTLGRPGWRPAEPSLAAPTALAAE